MSQPPEIMKPDRLSAFTDGVIAIIITIMVLELPVPHGNTLAALKPELPLFAAYALSFINVGIFWVNHHHMFNLAKQVDGRVLLANLFLLFWLSLLPFVIRWVGEAHISTLPVAAYGAVLLMASSGYLLTERALIAAEPGKSALAEAIGSKKKEIVSFLLYLAAVPLAFVSVWIAIAIYVVNAAIWFVPDPRVEKALPDR